MLEIIMSLKCFKNLIFSLFFLWGSASTYGQEKDISTSLIVEARAIYKIGINRSLVATKESNFAVVFNENSISPDFAMQVLSSLEFAYEQYIQRWGFQEPIFMKDKKMKVYLIEGSLGAVPGHSSGESLGKAYHGSASLGNPWIEVKIKTSRDIHDYNRAIFHEVFHAVQYGYVSIFVTQTEAHRWFYEATADAMADEVLNATGQIPRYA